MDCVLRAALLAAEKHSNQRRKGPNHVPYINHPLAVASVLAEFGHVQDPITLCAALLHDTLEDTNCSPDEIENGFGEEVLRVVLEVTDDTSLPVKARKREQEDRMSRVSPRAHEIKVADKVSNCSDIGREAPVGWSPHRRLEYLNFSRRVVDGCKKTVHPDLLQKFEDVVSDAQKIVEYDLKNDPIH